MDERRSASFLREARDSDRLNGVFICSNLKELEGVVRVAEARRRTCLPRPQAFCKVPLERNRDQAKSARKASRRDKAPKGGTS